jgi:D-3-phosphoglycerate dehydrogenase
VLVTPTSYGKNDISLKTELEKQVGEVIYNPKAKPLSAEEVAALLPGVDGYIAGLDDINRAALACADRLKVIARYGVGVDAVDVAAAREKGIIVTNTPGANSSSVAELAVGLMLALARQFRQAFAAAQEGKFPRLSGVGLDGKTVGIIGLGAIGKLVAQRLAAFDCRLVAYDPYPDAAFAGQYLITFENLDTLLAQSDFVSLHLPLTPDTRGMVNERFISKMKKGAYLVNTARGEMVDEAALIKALESGYLHGAALDALAKEPPDPASPLLALPNVITTPHLGAQTDEAVNTMGRMALNDCLAVLQGKTPAHPV